MAQHNTEMSETKEKEKADFKSLLSIWLLELSEVGIRTPQTSSYDDAYAFLASKSGKSSPRTP